ncbi:ArdC-like ssDNA-binding domain-containing protein [Sinorhizobium medicae]|uniref:ArdC-like ssDNA-binding domain-containing protein n=1 Tax=Sinorhizobium medicae TaxID=110321 RepID=UPI003088C911|nr:ArdC-like ssDNA-binding domain-containing protein [Sinorhizobium medicae]
MTSDIYQRVTDQIVAELEKGVCPWLKPWNAEHAAGRITRPLRANGIAYRGINVLMLWASAVEKGFAAPLWLTYKQAQELGGQVRKGEKGSPVVYANTVTRSEKDESTGEETERDIPFMKGYTVCAAFVCADLALTPELRSDHAAYIASWLEVLKGDKRAIFSAAAHAQRAADFLAGTQAQSESTPMAA